MTMDEWREQLDRIPQLWPGKKPLSEATMKAWFDELGRFTGRELFDALLSRMAMSAERAPGLAGLALAVRDAGGSRRPKQEEAEHPEDRERWNRLGKDWTFIGACMRSDQALSELYWGMVKNEVDPGDMRLSLLDEIKEREIKPRYLEPITARGGDLVTIGETLGGKT